MSFPQMGEALWGLTDPVQFAIFQKNVVDFQLQETSLDVLTFDGVLQPLHSRDVIVKPEGERNWKWYTLWTREDIPIDTVVQDPQQRQYRVMHRRDWHQAGYFEYEIVQQPKP